MTGKHRSLTQRGRAQCQAHADTARYEARKHLQAALDAMKHGEDENAIAHILDAIRYWGRAEAFVDMGKDVIDAPGLDDDAGSAAPRNRTPLTRNKIGGRG